MNICPISFVFYAFHLISISLSFSPFIPASLHFPHLLSVSLILFAFRHLFTSPSLYPYLPVYLHFSLPIILKISHPVYISVIFSIWSFSVSFSLSPFHLFSFIFSLILPSSLHFSHPLFNFPSLPPFLLSSLHFSPLLSISPILSPFLPSSLHFSHLLSIFLTFSPSYPMLAGVCLWTWSMECRRH